MTIQRHCNTGYERHTETKSNADKHVRVWIRNQAKFSGWKLQMNAYQLDFFFSRKLTTAKINRRKTCM